MLRSRSFLDQESARQASTINLIASENYVSARVRDAIGSVFTNKYSEGEPGSRYYQGNGIVDHVETYTNHLILEAFSLQSSEWHVNAKPLSAAIANFCVLSGVLDLRDRIMGMYLYDGGHLSHGWDMPDGRGVTVSSRMYDSRMYRVDPQTHLIDYDQLEMEALAFEPKIIITGGTAYPRIIDHERLRAICDKVGALYLADCAHEAGLIVAGAFPSPFPYADFVTFSTQKTLRGPRASVIICRQTHRDKIDRAIFPGLQGGPFMHHIFALATAMEEALTPQFRQYGQQVVRNAAAMADRFVRLGHTLVSGGTDKHLFSLDLRDVDRHAKPLTAALEQAGIVCNYNTVPHDPRKPFNPSGIRLGTPAITTRNMKEDEAIEIASLVDQICRSQDEAAIARVSFSVAELCQAFPIPTDPIS